MSGVILKYFHNNGKLEGSVALVARIKDGRSDLSPKTRKKKT